MKNEDAETRLDATETEEHKGSLMFNPNRTTDRWEQQ